MTKRSVELENMAATLARIAACAQLESTPSIQGDLEKIQERLLDIADEERALEAQADKILADFDKIFPRN